MLANTMRGEALTTHLLLLTLPFLREFLGGDLEWRDVETGQATQEFLMAQPG